MVGDPEPPSLPAPPAIVTHNVRDFARADRFGIRVLTPGAFVRSIGESDE
jgi:hypothetical protein